MVVVPLFGQRRGGRLGQPPCVLLAMDILGLLGARPLRVDLPPDVGVAVIVENRDEREAEPFLLPVPAPFRVTRSKAKPQSQKSDATQHPVLSRHWQKTT